VATVIFTAQKTVNSARVGLMQAYTYIWMDRRWHWRQRRHRTVH